MHSAGMAVTSVPTSIEARSIAALRLYQETVRLLHPHLLPEQRKTVDVLTTLVDQILDENIP